MVMIEVKMIDGDDDWWWWFLMIFDGDAWWWLMVMIHDEWCVHDDWLMVMIDGDDIDGDDGD